MSRTPAASLLDLARTVLRTEATAILRLVDTIDRDFERAIEVLFADTDVRTRDMGGKATCRELGDTLAELVGRV